MTSTKSSPARAEAANNVRELIRWAAAARSQPLTEAIRRRAATILSDDIGAMVVGSIESQVAQARQGFLNTATGAAEATVLAKGAARVDRYAAACANGMAITWCELDEGFRNASCHAGAYTIPALLAEAEVRGLTVDNVLRTLAVAYEVTTRFALAYPFPSFYVHPHAAFATIGAAAAVSLVRGHSSAISERVPFRRRWSMASAPHGRFPTVITRCSRAAITRTQRLRPHSTCAAAGSNES